MLVDRRAALSFPVTPDNWHRVFAQPALHPSLFPRAFAGVGERSASRHRCSDGEGRRLGNAKAKPAFAFASLHGVGVVGATDMLKWALIFAVVALIAGGLGFTGMAGAAAGIAKILFFLFLIGFVIFVALGVMAGKKISGG